MNLEVRKTLLILCIVILYGTPKGRKWPNPMDDKVIYVSNPIEADLPSHWIPLSIIKHVMEMRVPRTSAAYTHKYNRIKFKYTVTGSKPKTLVTVTSNIPKQEKFEKKSLLLSPKRVSLEAKDINTFSLSTIFTRDYMTPATKAVHDLTSNYNTKQLQTEVPVVSTGVTPTASSLTGADLSTSINTVSLQEATKTSSTPIISSNTSLPSVITPFITKTTDTHILISTIPTSTIPPTLISTTETPVITSTIATSTTIMATTSYFTTSTPTTTKSIKTSPTPTTTVTSAATASKIITASIRASTPIMTIPTTTLTFNASILTTSTATLSTSTWESEEPGNPFY